MFCKFMMQKTLNLFIMKHLNKFVLSFCILLTSASVFSQTTKKENLPNKNIDVKREYDKDGNLIRYDSTYVYSWSSDSTHQFLPDSILYNFSDMYKMRKKMQEQMEQFFQKDSSDNKVFRHPFFSDDFFGKDFFDPQFFRRDFFSKDSSKNDFFKELEEMLESRKNLRYQHNSKMQKELDSLRHDFLKQRQEYYQQRDSIYRKHNEKKSNTVDI